MRRLHLPIQNPCHENWNAMESDGEGRRFCVVCTKHVHDLSSMTERSARAVLTDESAKGRVCVRYTLDGSGGIKFKTETVEAPSLWRMTLAAAGVAMALMTGCTDSEPDRILADKCVYEAGPWSFTAERGQGTCPAEDPHEDVGEMVMGGIEAIDPPPEPPLDPIIELQGDVGLEPLPEPISVKGDVAVEPPEVMEMGEAPMLEPPPPEPKPERVLMGKPIAKPDPVKEPCEPEPDTGARRL